MADEYNPRVHASVAASAGFVLSDGGSTYSYVGNLDPAVTDELLATIFNQLGTVVRVKVFFDGQHNLFAFVEMADHAQAAATLAAINRRKLLNREMKVNWATEASSDVRVDTSKHFHIFVGDLSSDTDMSQLKDAFAHFGEISEVKIIRDPVTQKSKGYGFISFVRLEDAERAIEQMNGQFVGRRTIRTNWATRRSVGDDQPDDAPPFKRAHSETQSFDDVYSQTGPDNTSVYVGNCSPNVTEENLRSVFGSFGRISEVKIFRQNGFAFVRFDTKENACKAIVTLQGSNIAGQSIRTSWGKSDSQRAQAYTNWNACGTTPAGYGGFLTTGGVNETQTSAAQQQQQYWQYYQCYYNNPHVMQQWQDYYQRHGGYGYEGGR